MAIVAQILCYDGQMRAELDADILGVVTQLHLENTHRSLAFTARAGRLLATTRRVNPETTRTSILVDTLGMTEDTAVLSLSPL